MGGGRRGQPARSWGGRSERRPQRAAWTGLDETGCSPAEVQGRDGRGESMASARGPAGGFCRNQADITQGWDVKRKGRREKLEYEVV